MALPDIKQARRVVSMTESEGWAYLDKFLRDEIGRTTDLLIQDRTGNPSVDARFKGYIEGLSAVIDWVNKRREVAQKGAYE